MLVFMTRCIKSSPNCLLCILWDKRDTHGTINGGSSRVRSLLFGMKHCPNDVTACSVFPRGFTFVSNSSSEIRPEESRSINLNTFCRTSRASPSVFGSRPNFDREDGSPIARRNLDILIEGHHVCLGDRANARCGFLDLGCGRGMMYRHAWLKPFL